LKKIIFLIAVAYLFILEVNAQNPLGDDGNQFKLSSGYNINGIPVYVSYEMGIFEDITFGIEAAYRSFNEKKDSETFKHTIVGFSFFGNYYFNTLLNIDNDKWFLYGGVNMGYYKWFSPENYLDLGESSSRLAIGIQIGGVFYFKDWGLFLEGVGSTENAGGKFGVLYRFDY